MIHVIASIDILPGNREEFLAIFLRNVSNVLAEAGCIAYGPAIDIESGIPAQGAMRQDTITVVEQWESLEHLHAHLDAPHMQTYREEVKDLVKGVTLQVIEPVSE